MATPVGVVKWGVLIRSAKRRLFAKPLHPGIAAEKSRLKLCRNQSFNQPIPILISEHS
jgi:hypothetical protein